MIEVIKVGIVSGISGILRVLVKGSQSSTTLNNQSPIKEIASLNVSTPTSSASDRANGNGGGDDLEAEEVFDTVASSLSG